MPENWPKIGPDVIRDFFRGKEHAFSTIYDSYFPALIRYASAICGSREQAQDVVQDVFVELWEQRNRLEDDKIANWMVKVCKHKAIAVFRAEVRQRRLKGALVIAAVAEGVVAAEGNPIVEKEKAVLQAIETLPVGRKKIFILSRVHNKTYREIADELGISDSTVRNQMSEALKHIRNHMPMNEWGLLFLLCLLFPPY